MHDVVKSRMDMLERTVLELGTELYNMKGQVQKNHETNVQFVALIKGLKTLLDEKGLITPDDFEAAVELAEVIERFNAQDSGHIDLDKPKKSGH
jgi:hypothetical protein